MAPKFLSISGYTILPLELPYTPLFSNTATHYLYIQPHEPRIPDPDSSRSLFIVNIPITTTETHFRHLFGAQLSAGRVERVEFHDTPTKKLAGSTAVTANTTTNIKSRKRKRATTEELQNELEETDLPDTWNRKLHTSGSHAVVVFVDRPSMEASLKAAKKAAKNRTKIIWGEGIEDRLPPLGSLRYQAHKR